MSDPKEVSADTITGGSTDIVGMRLWKVVTVSGEDRQLVLRLYIGVLIRCCGVICIWAGASAVGWATAFVVGVVAASAGNLWLHLL